MTIETSDWGLVMLVSGAYLDQPRQVWASRTQWDVDEPGDKCRFRFKPMGSIHRLDREGLRCQCALQNAGLGD